jgi:hypothetical protein
MSGDGVNLSEATTRTLQLGACHVGAMRLYNAKINGALILTAVHLDGKDGPALNAESLTVAAEMSCDQRFRADGGVYMPGASIGRQLVFRGAQLNGKDGPALNAQGLTVGADMFCVEQFRALTGAFVAGWLVFRAHHPVPVGPGPHPAFNAPYTPSTC